MNQRKYILCDFSRVLLFPTDESYLGSLNDRYREIIKTPGYDYFETFKLNQELLDFLSSLAPKHRLSVFTSEIIQNDPAVAPLLKSVFETIISGQDLGVSKTEKETYQKVADQLNEKPENIIYIDDKLANVEAALAAGCLAIQYISNLQIIEEIKRSTSS